MTGRDGNKALQIRRSKSSTFVHEPQTMIVATVDDGWLWIKTSNRDGSAQGEFGARFEDSTKAKRVADAINESAGSPEKP